MSNIALIREISKSPETGRSHTVFGKLTSLFIHFKNLTDINPPPFKCEATRVAEI